MVPCLNHVQVLNENPINPTQSKVCCPLVNHLLRALPFLIFNQGSKIVKWQRDNAGLAWWPSNVDVTNPNSLQQGDNTAVIKSYCGFQAQKHQVHKLFLFYSGGAVTIKECAEK